MAVEGEPCVAQREHIDAEGAARRAAARSRRKRPTTGLDTTLAEAERGNKAAHLHAIEMRRDQPERRIGRRHRTDLYRAAAQCDAMGAEAAETHLIDGELNGSQILPLQRAYGRRGQEFDAILPERAPAKREQRAGSKNEPKVPVTQNVPSLQ